MVAYESSYGLTISPFQNTPDPRFLFRSQSHQEALDRLLYAVEAREMAVLVGEVGTGKTLLTRALLDELDDAEYDVAMLLNPRLSPTQLLRTLAVEWGVAQPRRARADLWAQLSDRLWECHTAGVLPVAIIEEAQLITRSELLDELRLLTNFQLDDANLLSLILVGQPELKETLGRDRLRAFRQRIGVQYELLPLTETDSVCYVQHRLAVAGRVEPLFTTDALAALYQYSQGLPRSLNHLANMALLAGFASGARGIDGALVHDVAHDVEGRWRADL